MSCSWAFTQLPYQGSHLEQCQQGAKTLPCRVGWGTRRFFQFHLACSQTLCFSLLIFLSRAPRSFSHARELTIVFEKNEKKNKIISVCRLGFTRRQERKKASVPAGYLLGGTYLSHIKFILPLRMARVCLVSEQPESFISLLFSGVFVSFVLLLMVKDNINGQVVVQSCNKN